jgi:Fe-S-cluster containining protein
VTAAPDCTACGCCCFTQRADWVPVFAVDEARMGEALVARLTAVIAGRRAMHVADGRCAALVVDPVSRSFRCAIYSVRPDACRWLVAGGGECAAQIAEKRAVASEALVALRRAGPPPTR